MNGIVVVVSPEGPWGKQRHGLVEKASVGGRVRHVGAEVDCGSINLWIGRYISDG